VARTLLSEAFDLAVYVGVALAVGVAPVGRTLLSDAFDLAVAVAPYHEIDSRDKFGAYTSGSYDWCLAIFTTLVSLVITVLVGAILVPRLQSLRELLGRFSSLNIPTLDSPDPFSELPLEEASRRRREREDAVTTYNALFRDYGIKYGHLRRVALPFLLIVSTLVVASALQLPLGYGYRVGVAASMLLLLALLVAYLRSHVAPRLGEVVSIDYVGEHFTNLLYQSLLDVMDMQVHWMTSQQEEGVFRFQLVTRLWVSGFKFLFAVTDPGQKFVYFASYGTVNDQTKFTHFLDPGNQLFACHLGDCDYRQIPEPQPDLHIHLWLFIPAPKSWQPANIQHPSILQDALVVDRPGGGGKAFLVSPPHISFKNLDKSVRFSRTHRAWSWDSWEIRADASSAAVLKEFVPELPYTSGIVTVKYPTGRPLNRAVD
jgi:hypothetical protein